MRTAIQPAMFLLLALPAAMAGAETYKWVDAKGVVNYSSTPPPAAAAKPQVIAERVSVLPPDPSFAPAAAALEARLERRAQYEEAEFARRQQYMLDSQMSYPGYTYADSAYYPYAYGGLGYGARPGAWRFAPKATPYGTPIRPYSSLPSYSSLPTYGAPPAGVRPAAYRR